MHVKNWRLCSQTWNKLYNWVWDGGKWKLCIVYLYNPFKAARNSQEKFQLSC